MNGQDPIDLSSDIYHFINAERKCVCEREQTANKIHVSTHTYKTDSDSVWSQLYM